MKTELAKSPEVLAKEKKIKDLSAKLKKSRSTLKSLKTRLKNMQEEVTQKQDRVFREGILKMEDAEKLRLEVVELGKKFLKVKGISKDDKISMKLMLEEFSADNFFGPDFAEHKQTQREMENGDFDYTEQNRSRMEALFQEFQVKPEEKEQRNIRKVFLKLSKIFHPDKAESKKEAENYHEIMQQLNQAYQNNDIQTILDIEQMYLGVEEDLEVAAVTIDDLQAKIDRLTKELDFIKNQITRTSKEISSLRKSDLGQMLTSMNRAEKEGVGISFMAEQMDAMISDLTRLRDGLQDSVKLKKFSPLLMEVLNDMEGPMPDDFFDEGDTEDLLYALFGGLFEEEYEYDPDEDEYLRGIDAFYDNLKFSNGTCVRIKKPIKALGLKKGTLKGWQGIINGIYDDDGKALYSIEFDKSTIEQMPPSYIRYCVAEDQAFYSLRLEEDALEACKPKSSAKADKLFQRKIYHQYNWEYLGEDRSPLMNKIMSRLSKGDDQKNWTTYLAENMTFPFEAKVKDKIDAPIHGKVVTVLGFNRPNPTFGLMMKVRDGRRMYEIPLYYLIGIKSSKYSELLFLYEEWKRDGGFIDTTELPF